MIDRELFCRLLGLSKTADDFSMVQAAMKHGKLMSTALSLAHSNGAMFGPGSTDWLRRVRERTADYTAVLDRVREVCNVRTLKGPGIARRYPAHITRHVGDLDLILADEAEVWAAAKAIMAIRSTNDVSLTVLGQAPRDILTCVRWNPIDPLLDNHMRVDISTIPYFGDLGTVPFRWQLPEDEWLADLLALLEDGLRHPFGVKEILDVIALDSAAPEHTDIVIALDHYRLAPEAQDLLTLASKYQQLDRLIAVLPKIEKLADRERQRRSNWKPPATVPESVPERMNQRLPVYGLPLAELSMQTESNISEWVELDDDACIALTPVGDYLMVSGQYVKPDLVERALARLSESRGRK